MCFSSLSKGKVLRERISKSVSCIPLRNLQEMRNVVVVIVVAIMLTDVDHFHCLLRYFLHPYVVCSIKYIFKNKLVQERKVCFVFIVIAIFRNNSRKNFPKCARALHNFPCYGDLAKRNNTSPWCKL